ncbi:MULTISPECIES: TetR family transcriptional regulator [unclassified Janthinobacterium]|uniref:TetR family transcriptional regulator n=1 Tax=unclassified Janthinobacterium TaxID=2610881 RepID=UPI00161DDC31|nr:MULTISPECIES: TetR family transcriptional regulator [unclassified Janthinobacterium]MBB5605553.1 AcrR family transcriptional regulator [Janthinobacterium sp. S3T4]MBB5611528.1 AcrR family transcriptional regulator [Janthinobacterium sp. S3M3]
MKERARSIEDKQQRYEALLDAAESLALALGGVRFVTVAAVTDRAGLHRTGVRRYYANKEELLLELAERCWMRWRDAIENTLGTRLGMTPMEVAGVVADTIISLPVFCDLLTHVTLSLEGAVDIERARRYKTNAFAAHDKIASMLVQASSMTEQQLQGLLAATIMLAAGHWQVAHPTPTLAQLYQEVPAWGHVALDFGPRLRYLLQATAAGLVETIPPSQ